MSAPVSLLANRRGWMFEAEGDLALLIGRPKDEVCPGWLSDICAVDQRDFLAGMLRDAAGNAEGRANHVSLRHASGRDVTCHLTIRPAGDDRWWIDVVPTDGASAAAPSVVWVDYFDSVAYLSEAAPELPIGMMLVSVGALAADGSAGARRMPDARLDEDARAALRTDIEEALAEAAVGRRLSRLDHASYAFLSAREGAGDGLLASLAARAVQHGFKQRDAGLAQQQVDLGARQGRDPASLRRLLAHLRHRFLGDLRAGVAVPRRSSLGKAGREIELSQRQIREALDARRLALTIMPVVDLATGRPVLHLGYGNLVLDGEEVAASRLIVLADYPQLALYHDLAVARMFCRNADAARKLGAPIDPIVIDVEAGCLGQPSFLDAVAKAAADWSLPLGALGFRLFSLRGSADAATPTAFLRTLLARGHPLWLMRFAAALGDQDLEGAYVEVSADYLRRLCGEKDGGALVARLITVWRRSRVEVVATGLQDASDIEFVRALGIGLGLGAALDHRQP